MIKVDVCVSTRKLPLPNWWLQQLKHLPHKRLLVDTSKPLGKSRQNLIGKVQTKFFVMLDDDVQISNTWFSDIYNVISSDDSIGCVCGCPKYQGRGRRFDRELTKCMQVAYKEMKLGDRATCLNNSLFRTDAVRGWKPSLENLSSWEDYDITQFVLKNGYKWIQIKSETIHYITWMQCIKAQLWSMEGYKKFHAPKEQISMMIKLFGVPIKNIYQFPFCVTVERAFSNLFGVLGLIIK